MSPVARINPSELATLETIQSLLASYPYVAIDELNGTSTCGGECGTIIDQLGADAARVMFFINISPGNPKINDYSGVLSRASKLKKLLFETYETTPTIRTSTRGNDDANVATWMKWTSSLGVLPYSMLVLGISNDGCPSGNTAECLLNDPPNDFAHLESFFGALHSQAPQFDGLALDAPGHVIATSSWSVASLYGKLAGLIGWW
jgi:hypothetical protein